MNSYGDTVDQAAMPLLAINDGPMLTMIAMGVGGLADIPFMALVAAIGPILVGQEVWLPPVPQGRGPERAVCQAGLIIPKII